MQTLLPVFLLYQTEESLSLNRGNILSVVLLLFPSNVTLIGRGNVILNVASNVPVFRNYNYSSDEDERIVISGFKIVVGCSYTQNLIDMKRVSHSVLEKLTIESDSQSVSTSSAAIKFEGVDTHECEGNVISECSIEDYGTSSDFGHGIRLYSYCNGTMISNNFIKTCRYGIFLDGSANSIESNIISNNSISSCKVNGIYSDTCYYSSIVGNEIFSNEKPGIVINKSERLLCSGECLKR